MHSPPPRPRLIAITWPLLAELVLGLGVGFLGLWVASTVSDNASAAFALANQLQVSFFLLFRIISMGVSVVITQNLGAGNRQDADRTARAALGASTWMGLLTAITLLLGAQTLLGWLNAPPAVQALATPYLQTLALALLLDAYNAAMAAVVRAHLRTRETMYNVLAMHSLHLLLCVPLMRGWGPLPGLGLPGFAVAMALSRAFGLAIHVLLWRWLLQLKPLARDWWSVHWERLRPVLHIGLPGAAENIAYRLAMLCTVSVVATLGAADMATQSYAMQIMNIVVLFGLAIGLSCEILVGHLVGAGQLHQAHALLRKCLFWGWGVSLAVALLAALTAPWTLRLFTRDPHILASATALLWITVVLEPGRTCNLIVINALRATGDARFPVMAGAASMLFVMAGGAWLLGLHFKLGLVGVWIAYAADEWLRGLTMAARWFRLGWLPSARATRRRVLRLRKG
jgi:putative MATE family efflux protein